VEEFNRKFRLCLEEKVLISRPNVCESGQGQWLAMESHRCIQLWTKWSEATMASRKIQLDKKRSGTSK
jgi:hypothetical protein